MIVVSGPPATGKTAITNALEREFGLPVISKDRVKERLFDERGVGDKRWSRQLGKEAYAIVLAQVAQLLSRQESCILEGNFTGVTAEQILQLADTHNSRLLSILCDAPDEVILDRMKVRWESGLRHPGHVDDQTLSEITSGRDWDKYRNYVFSTTTIRLDDRSTLSKNIDQAQAFVKKYIHG